MLRIQELKKERKKKKTPQLQNDSELGPAHSQGEGHSRVSWHGLSPPPTLLNVSPGRKLKNQGAKTLPAASECAREERDVYVVSPPPRSQDTQSRRQRLPIQLRAGAECPGPGRTKRGFRR